MSVASSLPVAVVSAVLLLVVEFVLTVALMSASTLSRVSLHRLATDNGGSLGFLEGLKNPSSTYRIAVHIARQLSLLATLVLTAHVGNVAGWRSPWLLGLAVVAVTVVFVFDSVVARSVAVRHPRGVLRRVAPVVRAVHVLLFPLAAVAARLVGRFVEVAPRSEEEREDEQEEEVEAYFEVGEREGILEADEGKMMRSIVDLGDTLVREIMTPRPDIEAIPVESTVADARRAMIQASHSKLPVYRESIENVVGVLHMRDLFQAWDDVDDASAITPFVRPPFFVPETQTVDDLLDEVRTRTAIALVVDEYGGIAGLVTLEDILEEIVGDIRDEHDDDEELMEEQPDGSWALSGLVHVESLEELFDVELDIEDRDFDTVGGLVVSELGRVPSQDESLSFGGLVFTVTEADPRRVYRVRVGRAEPEPPADGHPGTPPGDRDGT